MADITYCINGDCPFKNCDRHHSKIKSAAKATGYVSVADFGGTCKRYLEFLVEECSSENEEEKPV